RAFPKLAKSNAPDVIRELLSKDRPLDVITVISRRFKGVQGLVGSLEDAVNNEVPLGELGDVALRFPTVGEFAEFLEESIEKARKLSTGDYDTDAVRLLTFFRS